MTTIDEYASGFAEEAGYLDFAAVGPLGTAVLDEQRAMDELLRTARFGSLDVLWQQDQRMRGALARVIRSRPDHVVFQPNTSSGLMQVMFGLRGAVAMSPSEFPSLTFAAVRASEALGVLHPMWLELDRDLDRGAVTPGSIRDQLTPECSAVAVSLVDFRTGYLADLDGIRQVIGDRLLIVDAIQGFGVVDAPWEVADVIVSGGQKWVRAGWGTGFLALSDRALERLAPVLSGFNATDVDLPLDGILPPRSDTGAFSSSNPSPIAEAMFATALEGIAEVGVGAINTRIAEHVSAIIDIADEFVLPVVSPRAEPERAGIVVLRPDADRLTALTASLFNHGISATVREGAVRLSPHVSTTQETLGALRAALTGFASA